VISRLLDTESLARARVHPFTILLAAAVYKIGEGWRSRQTWTVNERIVDALGDAFYLSFQNVEPTNKKIMLCLDVSSSMMGSYISGSLLSAAEATAALALVTARTEPNYITCAFAHEFRPVSLTPRMTLAEAMQTLYGHGFGGTDCALPITTALEKGIVVDLFVVYTDSETWVGRIHPSQALAEYRRRINPEAKLAVVAMTSGGFTIADPLDAGMLDVVGFDASVPELLRNFTLGLV
jgi:60 kDa SS-A/Ro ribonucleoprotein